MIQTLRTVLSRPAGSLAEDAAGLAALVVLLLVGLHLPSVV